MLLDHSGSVPPTWVHPALERADMTRVRLGSESSGSTDVVRFAVGTWIRWVRAGRVFGRLSASRDHLVVSAAYRKAVLQRVNVRGIYVRRVLFRQSIVFDTDNGSGDGVLVYGWGIRRILEALSDLGWPVSE